EDIPVFAKAAGAFSVRVIDGYVLDRWRDDPNMPSRVEDARIALLDAEPIRGKAGVHEPRLRWYGESKVRLQSPAQLDGFIAVEEIRIGGSKCTIIDRCPDPKVVSLLVLGPGEAAANLYKTLARKAIGAAAASIETPRFLPGGAGPRWPRPLGSAGTRAASKAG